ncbi:MAG: hypothetical protein ONB48_08380 [candidate division KSB1 bacterium]|nr:hypothetical protein [candidate division KSB1 bacterium]MDZ7276055.1 hypothetical protein [candidate division KSB1 bacterium]MDZ7285663.1 hypothetical protein [candidate division KSB1 bacterium]MDZ7298695.1 hypothetical protein [candidate division KSB1 bacterium]MDZ7307556.1 hypothetical protein [candidate division KSB1 bacterium]
MSVQMSCHISWHTRRTDNAVQTSWLLAGWKPLRRHFPGRPLTRHPDRGTRPGSIPGPGQKSRHRLAAILLLLLTATGRAQSEGGPLKLEHADSGRSVIEAGLTVMELIGNVRFTQDSLRVSCDRARRIPDRGLIELIGNVDIREGHKWLRAERVNYFENFRMQEALGRVELGDRNSRLSARKLTYYERDSLALAEQEVMLWQQEKRVQLACGRVEYRRGSGYARATLAPVLIEFDSLGSERMRLRGETITMTGGGSRVQVTGNVEIVRQGTRATCGEAEYFRDEKKIELRQSPVAWRAEEETRGEQITLFFNDAQQLEKSVVSGRATATSAVQAQRDGQRLNTLSGGRITTYFRNEQAERIEVEEAATGVYYVIEDGREKGLNRVQGDRLILFVANQELQRVVVQSKPGVSNGRFEPPASAHADSSGRGTRRD